MQSSGLPLLPLCFAIAFFAVGIPFWQVPFTEDPFAQGWIYPGLVFLATTPVLLVGNGIVRARRTLFWLSICMPAVDLVSIVRDLAKDPTSHNLFPIELIFFWGMGALIVVPGILVGLGIRTILRHRSA
jgi:hypothetical protein